MLSLLHIENIAVIEEADIEFQAGFNVLTGETGTGKSIIIDSINAILGERTSRDVIRSGAEKALITVLFHGLNSDAERQLLDLGLFPADDGTWLISRQIHTDGKNTCRVNGRPVNVSVLKAMGALLVNIHGQHDGQNLLSDEAHIDFLDSYAQNAALLNEYASKYSALSDVAARIRELTADEAQKQRQLEMLQYQINELQAANLKKGEEEALLKRKNLLANAGKIVGFLDAAYGQLCGQEASDGGAMAGISEAARALGSAGAISPDFAGIGAKAEELKYLAEEISSELRDLRYGFDFPAGELDRIEERLDALYRLKKKYGPTEDDMLAYLDSARAGLSAIEASGETITGLRARYKLLRNEASSLALSLSDRRRQKAACLQNRLMGELSELEMPGARFVASVEPCHDDRGRPALSPKGCDKVAFLISANRGEEPRALSRVASGGELSRIMLALKNVLSLSDPVDTLIFDEIDAGVSGRAAQTVAEKLYAVSRKRQVLCVTHLPQIAAMADTHFLIEKKERSGRTYTSVDRLEGDGRVLEIARVITGRTVTEAAAQNARELIRTAGQSKKSL